MKSPGIAIAACLLIGCSNEDSAARKPEPPKPAAVQPAGNPEIAVDQRTQAVLVVEQARERAIPVLVTGAGRITPNELRTLPDRSGSDLSTVWLVAPLEPRDLNRVRIGMLAGVYVDTDSGKSFPGVVTRVEDGQIRIEVPNKDLRLTPDADAEFEIEVGRSAAAVYIPAPEPQRVDDKTVVFVQKVPGRFEIRPIVLGRKVEDYREITEGIKPGETLVVQGSAALKKWLAKQ